jgi:methylated-DNA-[protein]-cysteine S-methyltransferase
MPDLQPETLTLGRVNTPTGEVLLITDGDGAVRALDFAGFEARMMRLLGRHWPLATLVESPAPPTVRAAVEAYFDGELAALDGLAVRTSGTVFQRSVWAALRAIPHGETRTYGQLAAAIGKPKAVRAAGLANGQNPVALIVPCHRVIGANGSLTGYAGGIERKRWLLDHERRSCRGGPARVSPAA